MTVLDTNINSPHPSPIALDQVSNILWSKRVKIYHGQCDPAGIVYTPVFFDLFNQVIEDWFEGALGLSYYEFLGARQTGLGYVNVSSNFFIPCKMGEWLDIFVAVTRIGSSSYTLVLHAFKGDCEALRGQFTCVTTSLETHSSVKIPEDIKLALVSYDKKS